MNEAARPSWKDDWKKLYGLILVLSLVFIVLGFVLEHDKLLTQVLAYVHREGPTYEYLEKIVAHLLTEIGIAGLIACGLAATIERLSAKEFIKLAAGERETIQTESKKLAAEERKNIKEDVFYYVFASDIPEKIRNEITTQILKALFVREKVSLFYTLKGVADPLTREKYILLDLQMAYEVRNLTSIRQRFPLKSSVEVAPTTGLADQAKFISVSVADCEKPFALKEGSIKFKKDKISLKLDLEDEVWVLPKIPGKEMTSKVFIHSQTIKYYEGGADYFRFTHHTCDLDLTVQVLDEPLQIYAGVFGDNQTLKPTDNYNQDSGYYNWTVELPILAFQGIYITWSSIKQDTNAMPTDSNTDQKLPGDTVSAGRPA